MNTNMISNQNRLFQRGTSRLLSIGMLFFLGATTVISLPVVALEQVVVPATAGEVESGRRIYLEGKLPSGAALTGIRFGNTTVSGAQAACVNCHRQSGMGQVEGNIKVPPITGNFLFANKSEKHLAVMDPRVSKSLNQVHDPYTNASLADAILRGRNNQGREMNVAMPRYNLSEQELSALTAYLRQLSSQWSPGVTQSSIRFATVITPDVDPVRRKTMIDMIQSIFLQKNASTEIATRGHSRRHMTSAAEFVLGTERTWTLDIWELQGAPETWGEQLSERYRAQPVFALISGASTTTWQPVHDFCEKENVPCWFPSVDLPEKAPSQYSFYFSGGVMLEANVLARHLLDTYAVPTRLVQIYRNDSVGLAASQELARALDGSTIKVENRVLSADPVSTDSISALLGKEEPGDI
ncbi:MAG: c-type cytochrome, partial [Gallionella sp.]